MAGHIEADRRIGRVPVTTRGELSTLALELFRRDGFEQTRIEDIAAAAGIGRRTFFRYFSSKNDLPWGDFDALLDEMRRHLDSSPSETPIMEALRRAVVEFNRVPPSQLEVHRERMALLLGSPTLIAHSALRYASWRRVVAEFVAKRMRVHSESLEPQSIGWASLGLCIAAYEQWLRHPNMSLVDLLDGAFDRLRAGFEKRT